MDNKLKKTKFEVKRSFSMVISGICFMIFSTAFAGLMLYSLLKKNPTMRLGYFFFPAVFFLLGYVLFSVGKVKENMLLVDGDNLILIKNDQEQITYKASDILYHTINTENRLTKVKVYFKDGHYFESDNSYSHQIALMRYLRYQKEMNETGT